MKRLIIMLLIACSAITTASADPTATPQKKAKSVIQSLEGIIAFYAEKGSQTLSVTKNPETGLIEASEHITPFTCQKEDLWTIPIGFNEDEPLSYQYMHLLPGNTELFNLKVVTNNGQKSKDVCIRTNSKQEMWFMCCKNPDNPMLRDAYAIVWEETKDKNVAGTVYMITSLRPDLYTKNQETAKNTFRIDGRVGNDLTDSLYVVYMANTLEELDKQADDAFIEYMPVVNRHFSFSVEIDKPKVGRIRTVMPDGSLCHLWTNLDFVPGETYHITTHNGYYDEDLDYELRVGRHSGKSLIAPQQKSVTITGDFKFVDSKDDKVADTSDVETVESYLGRKLPPEETSKVEARVKAIQADAQMIDEAFDAIKNTPYPANGARLEELYNNILTLSKSIDTHFQGLVKVAKDNCLSPNEQVEMYKFILDMYRDQNKKLNEASSFHYNKSAQKLQKYITSQTEKYLNEMTKL